MRFYVATIKSEGIVMPAEVELLSVEVRKQLDRIPEAKLVLVDGSVAAGKFSLSNTDFFAPGKTVQILLRYGDGKDQQVFAGLVVRHSVEARDDASELRVELKDAAHAMTRARRSAVYRDQRDDEVLGALIARAGLRRGVVDRSAVTHGQLVQHNASDWDFLLSRADVNGQVVIVDDGTLSVRAMGAAGKLKASFTYGLSEIADLSLELDGSSQWGAVTSTAWDPTNVAQAPPASGAPLRIAAGNLAVDALATKLGGDSYALLMPASLPADELKAWADARLARSRLALLRGRLVVAGDADLKPFDRVKLDGVGERFNGTLLVGGVIHRVDADGWWTELEIGLSPEWFARRPDIADPPAGGLLPPAMQLQIGVVEGFESDPDRDFRLRVRLPAQDPLWARIARPDAGDGRGDCRWPEPGDEVVIGFLGGDPRQAVVLGSLFGGARQPPAGEEPSEGNNRRAIVSRSGVKIAIDDERVALTISTPGGNRVVIDDDADAITLADRHGNTITMDSRGIKLKSASDFAIEAAGKVVIQGSSVDIQ